MNNCNTKLYTPDQYDDIQDLREFEPESLEDYIITTYAPNVAQQLLTAIRNGDFDVHWKVKSQPSENNKLDDSSLMDDDTEYDTPNTSRSIKSYFADNSTGGSIGYNSMIKRFTEAIISRLIYDKENPDRGVVDPNSATPSGLNLINEQLYTFKIELIDDISKTLGLDTSWYEETNRYNLTDQEFTRRLWHVLGKFEDALKVKNDKTKLAYSSYVLLKNFDNLIKEKANFISIRAGYSDDIKGLNMYEWTGGKAPHRRNFDESEDYDISKYTDPLINILLDYFPEVDANGMDLPVSISMEGFNRVMSRMLDYFENESYDQNLRDMLYQDADADWELLINKYIEALTNNKGKLNDRYRTVLINKLRGIQKHIFGKKSGLSKEIKNDFIAHFLKTIDCQYVVYDRFWNKDTNQYEVRSYDLRDNFVNLQSLSLQNSIKTAVYRYKHDTKAFNRLKEKYGIDIKLNKISFNPAAPQKLFTIPQTMTVEKVQQHIKFAMDNESGQVENNILSFLEEFLQLTLPSDYQNYLKVFGDQMTLFRAFDNAIGLTLWAINDTSKTEFEYNANGDEVVTWKYGDSLNVSAKFLSYIYGSDVMNTLKNSKGNNLPLYSLRSYIYDFKKQLYAWRSQQYSSNTGIDQKTNVFANNPFVLKPNLIKHVNIRSELKVGNRSKESRDLNFAEVMQVSIIQDFYRNLIYSDTIKLQPIVFADKRTHFLVEFDTSNIKLGQKSLHKTLFEIAKSFNNKEGQSRILSFVKGYRQSKTKSQILNLIERFNIALDLGISDINKATDWNTIQETLANIEKSINKYSLKELRQSFRDKNVSLYEEFDLKFANGQFHLNETLLESGRLYWDKSNDAFQERINREKMQFAKDLVSENFILSELRDGTLSKLHDELQSQPGFKSWYDSYSKQFVLFKVYDKATNTEVSITPEVFDSTKYKIKLNPLLESYFWAELALSTPYSDVMFGDTAGYPSKFSKFDGLSQNQIAQFSEASRLSAQYKRTMVGGSTRHSYVQNLKYGVPSWINVMTMDDINIEMFNVMGIRDKLTTQDGAGFIDPNYSIMENNSAVDAAVRDDKKTLWLMTDPQTGVFTEVKWAAYALTNHRRTLSQESSPSSGEILFQKMNSKPIDSANILNGINFSKYYDPNNTVGIVYDRKVTDYIYYKDIYDNTYYRIDKITNLRTAKYDYATQTYTPTTVEITKTQVDKYGHVISNDPIVEIKEFNTLYDLDQILGGAYNYKMDFTLGKTVLHNYNNLIAVNIIGDNPYLKSLMTGYAINHSAMKVGIRDLNATEDVFNNPDYIPQTFKLSTRFGGIQMDASHDIQGGSVSEMSQMISSLTQFGYSTKDAERIYSVIGAITRKTLQKYIDPINKNQSEQINLILGKALIKSLNSANSRPLGLAQSFIMIAEEELQKGHIDIKIPFSSPDIKNAFITTITAEFNKLGIKKKYPGLAGVLTPSYNMIQYYLPIKGSSALTFEELLDELYDPTKDSGKLRQQYINLATQEAEIQFANLVNAGAFSTNVNLEKIKQQHIDKAVKAAKKRFLYSIFHKITINGQLNPTIVKQLTQSKQTDVTNVEFEDTVVYKLKKEDWKNAKTLKIQNISDYDFIRHQLDKNLYDVAIWTIKPRNLKSSLITIETIIDDKKTTWSEYDLDRVRANYYLQDIFQYLTKGKNKISKLSWPIYQKTIDSIYGLQNINWNTLKINLNNMVKNNAILTKDELKDLLEKHVKPLLKETEKLTQEVYDVLSDLSKGIANKTPLMVDGMPLTNVSEVVYNPAECIIGKNNATALGIDPGETIADVLNQGTRFFANKFERFTQLPETIDPEFYDACAFTTDNKKVLILVGNRTENRERLAQTSKSADFRNIDGDIYYNDNRICSSQGKTFREIIDDEGQKHYVIQVDTFDRLYELSKTGWIDIIKLNYNQNNWKRLLIHRNKKVFNNDGTIISGQSLSLETQPLIIQNNTPIIYGNLKPFIIDQNLDQYKPEDILKILKDNERIEFNKLKEKQAYQRFVAFKRQLEFIAARIPTQSMQSFTALKVIMYTESNLNDVYVPTQLTWLSGADYDIDKEYMMTYALTSHGVIPTLSDLDRYRDYDIQELLRLPVPDSTKLFTKTEVDDPNAIVLNDIMLDNYKSDLNVIKNILLDGRTALKYDAQRYNDKEHGNNYRRKVDELLNRLNLHQNSDKEGEYLQKALRNTVVQGIFDIIKDPINQINLQKPISYGDARKAAENSTLGQSEKFMTFDNPATKFKMQIQNMVGREVIGTGATSLKGYFAASLYYNLEIQEVLKKIKNAETPNGKVNQEVFNHLKDLIFDSKLETGPTKLRTLGNINFKPLLAYLNSTEQWDQIEINDPTINEDLQSALQAYFVKDTNILKFKELIRDLQIVSNQNDAPDSLSAIISAATDFRSGK